jgi:hypothetical protein
MKLLKLTIFFALISSCSHSEKKLAEKYQDPARMTEQEVRKMFIDTISNMHDYWPGIFTFFRTYYPSVDISGLNNQEIQITYALEEEFFDKSSIDSSRQVIRLIFKPTFSAPWCVKLELKNGKTYFTTKILSGEGGYYNGYLTLSLTQVLPDSIIINYMEKLNKINFWELKNDTTCNGYDGTSIYFDAIDHNKLGRVYRWTPWFCQDSVTVNLGRIADSLSKIGLTSDLRMYPTK